MDILRAKPAGDHETIPLDTATRLAYERTFLAMDRTQMAWVRTALSLISFGFTIAKFFEYSRKRRPGHPVIANPRTIGILMIAIGLVSLALGTVQHFISMRLLRKQCPDLPISLAGITSGLLALLGILALVESVLQHVD